MGWETPWHGDVDPLPSSGSGEVLIRHKLGRQLHVVKEPAIKNRLGFAGLHMRSKHDVGPPRLVWGHGLRGLWDAHPLYRAVLCALVSDILFQLQRPALQ